MQWTQLPGQGRSHMRRATKPVCHNYWATTRAHALQREATVTRLDHHNREALTAQQEKPTRSNKTHRSQKLKEILKKNAGNKSRSILFFFSEVL